MSDSQWFDQVRYGMFIHWGPYAVAGRGEWVMNRERIPFAEYSQKYAANFHAERYDPAAWAALARDAGMGYVVLTTRHHDGFCLWNTATSDFNAAKIGPRRDLLAPYVEALRKAGLKVGFYFSAADWRHPDYPTAYARDWPETWHDEASRKRFVEYYFAQLQELMTRYGKIDLLWYDGCMPGPLDGARVNQWIKSVQPHILINERNGRPFDFRCSEQNIVAKEGPWEACMTLNDNWGYHAGDTNWKTARQVIYMLLNTAKDGGNLLLNVGPRPDGTIQEEAASILRTAGDWLRRNREFLSSSSRTHFNFVGSAIVTMRASTIYLHLQSDTLGEYCFANIANKVLSARYLESGLPVRFTQTPDRLFLHDLPSPLPDPIATTIVLEVEGEVRAIVPQKTSWIPG